MGIAVAGPKRYARALRSRPFALLWAGQAISALGDGTFYIALAWQVQILTGSGIAMAGVMVAGTIPRLLFFLIGGVAADRLPRRLVLLWSDTIRAAIVLLIALLGWTNLLQMWHLIALSLFFGVVDGFFSPAYQAIIPQLVEKDALPSANALGGIGQKVGLILGPALAAGSITLLATPASAFAFNGLTFVVSALCILALRLPAQAQVEMPSPRGAVPVRQEAKVLGKAGSVLHDAREGFRYVLQSGWLRVAIPLTAICNIAVSGPSQVAAPKLVQDFYGAGPWLLSTIVMASSIGSIVAMFLVGQLHLRRRGPFAFLTLLGIGLAMVVYGLPLPKGWEPVVATTAGLVGGMCLGFFSIIWVTVLQEIVPGDKLGRVSSIDMLGSFALLPAGYALVGVLTDWLGASWVFIGAGLLNLVLCLVALSIRDIRSLQ